MWSEIRKAIASFKIPADWIGMRVVRKTPANHYVRDGLPQHNGKSTTIGASKAYANSK